MSDNFTLWITRPEGQAVNLITTLEQQGIKVISLPMLVIEPLEMDEAIKNRVLALDNYDLLFFISSNAARLGMELLQNYWPQFPVHLKIYAPGPTTVAVLEDYDLAVECPTTEMSSEALLALDSLQDIANKKALIIRGEGGRELLATELQSRGASVDYLEVYRRNCPDFEKGKLAELMKQAAPDAVVVTSTEALSNMTRVLIKEQISPENIPLFVSSSRISQQAIEQGFKNIITMSGPDDKAIINCLEENR